MIGSYRSGPAPAPIHFSSNVARIGYVYAVAIVCSRHPYLAGRAEDLRASGLKVAGCPVRKVGAFRAGGKAPDLERDELDYPSFPGCRHSPEKSHGGLGIGHLTCEVDCALNTGFDPITHGNIRGKEPFGHIRSPILMLRRACVAVPRGRGTSLGVSC